MASPLFILSNIIKCKNVTSMLQKSFNIVTSAASHTNFKLFNRYDGLPAQQISKKLHVSAPSCDLMEFFDKKDNWGEETVRVGRPWKLDELRLKSNEDLHKLWYVLLKERNMLMTMEAEYKRQCELFPSPERLEKVEESMENILDVVAERDNAYSLLETGEPREPGRRWAYNELGMGYWHKCTEHYVPLALNNRLRRKTSLSGPWQHKYLRLMREQRLRERGRKLRRLHAINRAYSEKFPDAQPDIDLSEFKNTLASSMKGPKDVISNKAR